MLLLAATALIFSLASNAQCATKVLYTISKLEMLDSAMQVTDTKDVTATFATSPSGIFVHKSEKEGDTMAGTIIKATCNWAEPYKNGKVVIVSDIHQTNEDLAGATITIEAINGKITILMHAVEYPDKLIRLLVDKYEENPKN